MTPGRRVPTPRSARRPGPTTASQTNEKETHMYIAEAITVALVAGGIASIVPSLLKKLHSAIRER